MKKTSTLKTKAFPATGLLVNIYAYSFSAAGTYKDVYATHKAEDSIKYLTEREIITEFTAKSFRSDDAVTKAQLSKKP
ncbi:S-layer homology domain-containing protein [Planococcus sp. 4-30]|uniref:S-layer homology domain-containing protein n=1 Tax=Planococcus sp. 4-30 TaxID=2874583 RepID=UPI001CBFCA97|nr:S-layer homology domain-containing protein [Planococcus sp. 4-30]